MTAEIAVMNRDAVALAADSTVTIEGSKAYHTINKLFSLSRVQPVGVMVYGSGSLAGVPWETIIKLFRTHIGPAQRDFLIDYVVEFIDFLESDFSEYLNEEEKEVINDYIDEYLCAVYDRFQTSFDKVIELEGEISEYKASQIIRNLIKEDSKVWAKKQKLPFYSEEYKKRLLLSFSKQIDRIIENYFEDVPISQNTKSLMINVVTDMFLSFSAYESGIVFSGYGYKEVFPALVEIRVECFMKGKLKHESLKSVEIGKKGKGYSNSYIIPFAQSEIIAGFMNGYSRKIHDVLTEDLRAGRDDLLKLIDEQSDLFKNNDAFEEFKSTIQEGFYEFYKDVLANIRKTSRENHIQPVMRAISMLPKNEMAEVAETLVSLTSFSQKVSLEQETVGGAVDVAVISKGDGFVWIKRKHYFQPELNPIFMSKYIAKEF